MSSGVHLTLMIGPGVPVPAPADIVDAVASVQVTAGPDRTGFQIVFHTSAKSRLTRTLLPAGYLDPIVTRVIIAATVAGRAHVLSDGVVTRHEVAPSSEPGASTLTVTGEDLGAMMDLAEMPFMLYPGMNELAIVNLILAKYAVLGVVPIVVPPYAMAFPNPLFEIPTQQGTDLEYVKMLAARVGYVFYVEPGPRPGMNVAYWGPDIRNPVPQPALSINADAHTNVESLNFSLDGLAKKILVGTIMDPVTKKVPIPIPFPNINALKPPLGARPTPPAKLEFLKGMAKLTPDQAVQRMIGESLKSKDAIGGSGSLNVLRYGRPLEPRRIVGVRGAGLAYDGLYYVNSVTHSLKRGEYKQNFTLSRDGLVAAGTRVPA